MSLTSIFINDGLSDITHKRNLYGVARNLMENILSYRNFPCVYDEIRVGFFPSSKWFIRNAITNATLGGHKHLVEYFVDYEEQEKIKAYKRRTNFIRQDGPEQIEMSVWRDGLEKAFVKKHTHLIDYFLEKTGKTLQIFDLVIQYNYTPMIDYFMSLIDQFTNKQDKDVCWKIGYKGAIKGNNKKYIDYFLSQNITFESHHWDIQYSRWDSDSKRPYWIINGDKYYPTLPITPEIVYYSRVSLQTILKLAIENDNISIVESCFNRNVRIEDYHITQIFRYNNPYIINMLENYGISLYSTCRLIYCLIGATQGNHTELVQSLLYKVHQQYPLGLNATGLNSIPSHFAQVMYHAVVNKNQSLIDSIMGEFTYIRKDLALFAGCAGDWSLYDSILRNGLEGAIDIHDIKQIDYFINKGSIINSYMIGRAETSGYIEIYKYINKKYVEQRTHLMSLRTSDNNCLEINGSHVNIVDAKFMSEDMDVSIRTQIEKELRSQLADSKADEYKADEYKADEGKADDSDV